MNCPICKTSEMHPTELEANLPSLKCEQCGGNWIRGLAYWKWLEQHGPNLPERTEPMENQASEETHEMRWCPECQSLMFQYRVGRGLGFALDQCPGCKGIWFDSNEWEALKARNLHDDIHAIFTAPWQAAVNREERKRRLEQMFIRRFGEDDYAEIKRVRGWLDQHPSKHELLAYLTDKDPLSV